MSRALAIAVAVAAMASCADDSPAGDGSGAGGAGGIGGWGGHPSDVYPRPAAMEEHFGPAVSWAAPPLVEPLRPQDDFLLGDSASLRDFDGDALPDLLIVGEGGSVFGTAGGRAFRFFRNDGRGGFQAAVAWPVPEGVTEYGSGLAGEGWSLRQIDRDGRPDLLIGGGVERRLHRNLGGGFEAAPVSLRVPPDDGPPIDFLDLDGDGAEDLVQMQGPDGRVFGSDGVPHWRAQLGNGSAFEASEWPVPAGCAGGTGFVDLAGYDRETCGQWWTAKRDLTGDGRRDLLVTGLHAPDGSLQVPGFPDDPHWILYPSHGTGFGSAVELAFTAHPGAGWFAAIPTVQWIGDEPRIYDDTGLVVPPARAPLWFLRDMDGDRRPDLVFTSPALEAEAPYWSVYRNLGAAFAAPVAWPLPRNPLSDEVRYLHEFGTAREPCEPGTGECRSVQHWALTDLDGDLRPDLVEWGRTPAGPHFRVHFNR